MISFEKILSIQGFDINSAEKFITNLKEEKYKIGLETYREKYFKNIFEYHKKNNEFYSRRCINNNNLVLQKKDFQENLSSLISSKYQLNNLYKSSTSGSSGHPFKFAKDKFCHALTWARIKEFYASKNLTLNSLQARFYGIPKNGLSNWMEVSKDKVMNRVRFPVFDLSDRNLNNYLNKFEQYKFEYIYGYTSSLVLFARYCILNNINLVEKCPSLKCVIYTSETCTKEDRMILKNGFGIPCYAEYGASEVGIIAFENEHEQLIIDSLLLDVQTYKPENSELPTTLVSSFFNFAFPIIKYDIGDIIDLSIKHEEIIIEKLEGRTNDIIYLPNHKKAAGLTFYYISRAILEKNNSLKEFIIIQNSTNTFTFKIVSDSKLSENEQIQIKKECNRYLDIDVEIIYTYVKTISRLKNGKIKHFISEIEHDL